MIEDATIETSKFWGVSPFGRPSQSEVIESQRRRLFLGLSRAVARKGYAAASVADVLAEVRIYKRAGENWVTWYYPPSIREELVSPSRWAQVDFAVLRQLTTYCAVALYEICTRYKDVGQTARQPWRWWQPVLTGNPPSDKLARLEYRIFKRDTLKPAIAEIGADPAHPAFGLRGHRHLRSP